eukprot:comp27073_c0_seq1/m.47137 comp27073_c0_seq1/g.47137  ORF comp27073_c0_seq1/g.47137 comp27073_c0_seq1/m.47137 type:complete len:164 (-) comp27073_c0_seq1:141-632(-)
MADKQKKKKYEKPEGPPPKDATEFFRYRIETMMKNPDKEMRLPERSEEKGPPQPKDFFRNVMGSSAGAGSGEFHVFRATRRREYQREQWLEEKAKQEKLDSDYEQKRKAAEAELEEKAAKRRAKRLKKKQKKKKGAGTGAEGAKSSSQGEQGKESDSDDGESE